MFNWDVQVSKSSQSHYSSLPKHREGPIIQKWGQFLHEFAFAFSYFEKYFLKVAWSQKLFHFGSAKNEHFSCSHNSCQLGLKISTRYFFQIVGWNKFKYTIKKAKAPLCSGNRGTLQIEQRRLLTRRSMVQVVIWNPWIGLAIKTHW